MWKTLLETIKQKDTQKKPVWVMRQAGRYLPEYREIRARHEDFIGFCLTPEDAAEVTLQPLRRFELDAAIIFSDILVLPYALGVEVWFEKNHGPKLKCDPKRFVQEHNLDLKALNKVCEAISLTKEGLPTDKTLIGFIGAPWTLACYMVEEGGSKHFDKVKSLAYGDEKLFAQIVDVLVENSVQYLKMQIEAGCDVVKIFDSWAGVLSPQAFTRWVIEPTRRIVAELKSVYPEVPIIGFPRGAGVMYLDYARQVGVDVMAIDQGVPLEWAHEHLAKHVILQGNVDNCLVASNKNLIKKEVDNIKKIFADQPFIFNMGHGVLPQTPIENIAELVNCVKND
jgi:uroporphyrinogen decarboxylase